MSQDQTTVSPLWARVVRWLGGYVEAGPLLVAIHDQTTPSDDVVEAFLRLCEALGLQATAAAYLEVPALLRAAEERGRAKGRGEANGF